MRRQPSFSFGEGDSIRVDKAEWNAMLSNLGPQPISEKDASSVADLVSNYSWLIEAIEAVENSSKQELFEAPVSSIPGLELAVQSSDILSLCRLTAKSVQVGLMGASPTISVNDIERRLEKMTMEGQEIHPSSKGDPVARAASERAGTEYAFGSPERGAPLTMSNAEMCGRRRGEHGGVIRQNGLPVVYYQAVKGGAWYLVPNPNLSP